MKAILIDKNDFKKTIDIEIKNNREFKIPNKRILQRAYVSNVVQELFENSHPEYSQYEFYLYNIVKIYDFEKEEYEEVAIYKEK